MNRRRSFTLGMGLALGLGLTLGLFGLLGGESRLAHADPGILYVAPGGNCGGATPCYATVQAAVDVASAGDEIRVATGTYAGVSARAGVTQMVYISKTVTIRGGYTTANWTTSDSTANPTTLDAQGQGRVLYITGDISPTVEGLRITGGNASNVAANPGCGGGIYSDGADPIITNNVITNNVAYTSTTSWGYGGGIYLSNASASALISGNLVVSNTASTAYRGKGGGLYMLSSAATVSNNTFLNNVAGAAYSSGGGLHLYLSPAIVSGNLIQSNKSSPDGTGYGGGFYTQFGDITLSGNTVVSNASSYGALTFQSNASSNYSGCKRSSRYS